MKNVVAVVLAGGAGKRFWPLVTPKPLVNFLGKPLVWYNFTLLKKIGITNIILVIPPSEHGFALPVVSGISVQTVVQAKPLGMGNALRSAQKLVGERASLVINGDDMVEENLFQKLAKQISNGEMFIVGKKVKQHVNAGYLKLDGKRVSEIVEKPGAGKEPSQFVNLVFHFFPNPARFFELLEQTGSDHDDAYEKALSKLLKENSAQLIEYEGFWQSLKYPWHILSLTDYFLERLVSQQGKRVEIKENVTIVGPVYFGNNVKVFENTKIVGPCYIGDNTIIGNNNIIRSSHVGENCVTGFNTDITRSYVGDNCWFHSNYIGDSILEGDTSLGSGTVLANLRLDEGEIGSVVSGERQNTGRNKLGAIVGLKVRIGINVSVMPGVKIGSRTFVGAGVTLDRDIPEETFCFGKGELVMKKNNHTVANKTRAEFRKHL